MIKKQKTATNIMKRSRPTKGNINKLTLAVPELHNVAKHAADDIYLNNLI